MNHDLRGRRVRLMRCTDEYTRLRPGELGTVQFSDDFGTLHVRWDSGSTLGLVPDAGDAWELLPPADTCKECGEPLPDLDPYHGRCTPCAAAKYTA